MRRELLWRFLIYTGFILVAAAFLVFPALKNEEPLRLGLDLKGGIEVILAPDYRLEDRILIGVKNDLVEKMTQINVPAPQSGYLGKRENNKYDGLILTFNDAQELQRVLNAKVIPATMQWKKGIEDLRLKFRTVRSEKQSNVLYVYAQLDPEMFDKDAMRRAKEIISRRVNSKGLSETDVRYDEKNGRIQVQLPGISSQEEAEKMIQSTGRLNFRDAEGNIVMFGSDLKNAAAGIQPGTGEVQIEFEFGSEGAKQFGIVTNKYLYKTLAIYLDEEKLMEPVVKTPITDGRGVITMGNANLEEAKTMAILMRSGAMPISLRTIANTHVAPTLGSEMIKQSLVAGIIGILLVIGFMLLFYGLPGIIADVALIAYGILTLGALALLRGVLTLPGVAGLILSLGMAVDANVIIYERIKDELRNGKRLRSALESGFDRAFTAILDGNITTIIVGLVLLFFDTGPVKGFAMTLTIGIILSMFTAIYMTKNLLEMIIDRNPDKYAKFFGA